MARYSDYPTLTAEQFAEVMANDRGIREAHFSHGYNLMDGRTGRVFWSPIHKHTASVWGSRNEFKITDEQQAQADELFAQKKAQALAKAQEVGVLTFVCMGMDYESNIIGGLGNHRIRATFHDKKGHKWFVEVHPLNERTAKGDPDDSLGFLGTWYDVTFEENENERFKRETEALIAKYGSENKVPNWEWNERKWPEQRHGFIGDTYAKCKSNGKPVAYKPTTGRKFTANDLRVWINKTFGCNYKEFQLDRHFLSPDEYISRCMA